MMRIRPGLAIAATVAPLCGCTRIQTPLRSAGDQAGSILSLLALMICVCAIVYTAVLAFLSASLWRSRRHAAIDTTASSTPMVAPDDRGLTRGLGLWAAGIVTGLTILIVGSFLTERSLAAARAHETVRIRVTAHQWWWRIQYLDPATGGWIETANELHLPAGRTARVELGSADVIHSFWVPNLAGKMDVIPGRANSVDITPRRIGWYRGQCAEFCGAQHAHMSFDVRVDSAPAFAAWLRAQARPAAPPADAVVARGRAIVTGGACAMCHAVRGTPAAGRPGPDLTHVGGRRSIAAGTIAMSRGAIQGWIVQPQAIKPGTMMPPVPLAPADVDAAARYLVSLK